MFITQMFQRLFTQSPKFFRIMQIASTVLGILAYGLRWFVKHDAIVTTAHWENIIVDICNGIVAFAGGSFFASATTTTKAELIDDKTKINILKEN